MSHRGVPLCQLEEVAHFLGGGTPSRVRAEYFGGDIPWVKTTDLNNGYVSSTEETLTELGLRESSCKIVPPGSVLVAMYGGFNQIGRTGFLLQASAINQALTAVVPDPARLLPEFLLEWLNFRVAYWKRLAGSSRKDPNITKGDVLAFPVPCISTDQQRDAILVLRFWNTAIATTEKLLSAKERHREILISNLYAKSEREGSFIRFGELLRESSTLGSSGRHAHKITVKLYGKGVLPKEEKRQGSEQTQYFIRRMGQLIYSKLDFLNGAFGIIPPELDGYESTLDLPAFDIAPTINPMWLLAYLTRPSYYTRQVGLARGQRKARRVHPSDFLSSSLRVPPRTVQDSIARILTASRDEIESTKRLAESLKAQKRALMQKLLTGGWRLPLREKEAL